MNIIEGLEEYRAVKDELKLKAMLGPGKMGEELNKPILRKLENIKPTTAIERSADISSS